MPPTYRKRDLGHFSLAARRAVESLVIGWQAGHEDGNDLAPALSLLHNLDDEAPEILGEVMERGEWRARMFAAVCFMRGIENFPEVAEHHPEIVTRAKRLIVESLGRPNRQELRLTCEALGMIGGVPDVAVESLTALLEDPDTVISLAAATALSRLDHQGIGGRAKLMAVLRREEPEHVLLAAPILCLSPHAKPEQKEYALSALIRLLPRCELHQQCGIVPLLKTIGSPAVGALEVLKHLLNCRTVSSFHRARAAAAIGSVTKGTKESVDILSGALFSADAEIFFGAAEGLHLHGEIKMKDLRQIASQLSAEDGRLRQLAALAVQQMGPKARPVLPQLLARLGAEPDVTIVKAVSAAIAAVGTDAVEPLIEEAKKNDFRTIPGVLESFHKLAGKSVGEVIRRLLEDECESVQVIAVSVLEGLGNRAKEAIPALIEALRETRHVDVVVVILKIFAKYGQHATAAAEVVANTMSSCEDPDVQAAAAQALRKIGAAAEPYLTEQHRRALERFAPERTGNYPKLEQLDNDALLRYFEIVGQVLEITGKASWRKIGEVIEGYGSFERAGGKDVGAKSTAVSTNVRELADLLESPPLTTHRTGVAGTLTPAGREWLVKIRAYLSEKLGAEALPKIEID